MKAKWNYLLTLSLLLLFTTCKEETDYSGELGDLASTIQNDVAKHFLYQMKNQPGTYEAFQEVLQKDAASFEFTVLSSSPQFGIHYAIPYIQNGMVEGCIIYPMEKTSTSEDRNILDKLGIPLRINQSRLNAMPNNQKYFLSVQFLEWKENGIKVNPSLSTLAKTLEEQDQQISIQDISPISFSSTRGFHDAITVELYLEYKTNYTNRVSKDGSYIEVTAPNINIVVELMQRALEYCSGVNEAMVYHSHYQTLKIDITFEVGYQIDKQGIREIIRDASNYVNTSLYNSDHVVTFSTYYSYTLTYPNNYYIEGYGNSGNDAVFQGGSRYGEEDYETKKWLEEEERKRKEKLEYSTIKKDWTYEEKQKDLEDLLLKIKLISNLNLDSIKTVKANIDGFCGSNAQAEEDGSIIFCHKSFVKFEKRDRLAMLWHEIYHTNNDNKSFDPKVTQELKPKELIRDVPERIKTLMKNFATYDYEDWNTPDIKFKENMINQYYDSMLEVQWIHHPLYYENEVKTYRAEIENLYDLSYYYSIEREIQLWLKEQYWEISKRRWIYKND